MKIKHRNIAVSLAIIYLVLVCAACGAVYALGDRVQKREIASLSTLTVTNPDAAAATVALKQRSATAYASTLESSMRPKPTLEISAQATADEAAALKGSRRARNLIRLTRWLRRVSR